MGRLNNRLDRDPAPDLVEINRQDDRANSQVQQDLLLDGESALGACANTLRSLSEER